MADVLAGPGRTLALTGIRQHIRHISSAADQLTSASSSTPHARNSPTWKRTECRSRPRNVPSSQAQLVRVGLDPTARQQVITSAGSMGPPAETPYQCCSVDMATLPTPSTPP